MKLRSYQQAAVDAVYEHLRNRDDNPVAVLPTGADKSLMLAKIASDAVQQWNGRVLILVHVKELLEQNADKFAVYSPVLAQIRFKMFSSTPTPLLDARSENVHKELSNAPSK